MVLAIEERTNQPGVAVLEMKGRITLGNASQEIEWKFADLMKRGEKKVIFDLAGIQIIDSTGLGVLVTCFGRIRRAGGELRLSGLQPAVQDVLSMTSVDKVLAIFPSVAMAADNFQP